MPIFTPLDGNAPAGSHTGNVNVRDALQQVIDTISASATPDILDLQGGNWRFDAPLDIKGEVRIRNGRLLYRGTGQDPTAILARHSGPGRDEQSVLMMEDVIIERRIDPNDNPYPGPQIGLQIQVGRRIRLQRVSIIGWKDGGTGLSLEGVQNGYFEDCLLERSSTNLAIGPHTGLDRRRASTALTFTHCLFRSHDGSGASVTTSPFKKEKGKTVSGARRIHFAFCTFEDGRNGGFIDACASKRLTLVNCTFEDPGPDSPNIEFSDRNKQSFLNSAQFCRFSNTSGDPVPAQIVIGKKVRETLLIGNTHAVSTPAIEDNGKHTTILKW